MFEYARTYMDGASNANNNNNNHADSLSRTGSCSDFESPSESSAAKPPFSEQAPSKVTTVDIGGQTYRTPASVSKQFYLDLTYMEDEELISTYTLVKYVKHERGSSVWSHSNMGDLKR